jgi:hypothetical protein
LAFFQWESASKDLTTMPTGWTKLTAVSSGDASQQVAWAWGTSGGTNDPGDSILFTYSPNDQVIGRIIEVTGANAATPIRDSASGQVSGGGATSLAITGFTVAADDLLIAQYGQDLTSGQNTLNSTMVSSPTTTWTQLWEDAGLNSQQQSWIAYSATPATTGTTSVTGTTDYNDNWTGHLVAIAPQPESPYISDDFNRADEDPVGGWTENAGTGESLQIVSNKVQADGTYLLGVHETALSGDEQWAEVLIDGQSSSNNWREWAVAVRVPTDGGTYGGYMVHCNSTASTGATITRVTINDIVSSTSRSIKATVTGLADIIGKRLGIHVEDIAGDQVITAYVDGESVLTWTDTGGLYPALAANRGAGIWAYTVADTITFDDFEAGTGAFRSTATPGAPYVAATQNLNWNGTTAWPEDLNPSFTVETDDIIYAFMSADRSGDATSRQLTIADQSGTSGGTWVNLTTTNPEHTATREFQGAVWRKIVTNGTNESGVTYRMSNAGTDAEEGSVDLVVVRGAHTTTPEDVTTTYSSATNGNNPDPPSITPVSDDSLILTWGAVNGNSVTAWVAPDGYTLNDSQLFTTSHNATAVASRVLPTAAAENPAVFTATSASGDDTLAVTIAVRSAGVTGTTTHVLAGGVVSATTPAATTMVVAANNLAGDVASVTTPTGDLTITPGSGPAALAGDIVSVTTPGATGMVASSSDLAGDIVSAVTPAATGMVASSSDLAGGVASVVTPTGNLTLFAAPAALAGGIVSDTTPGATTMVLKAALAGGITSDTFVAGSMTAAISLAKIYNGTTWDSCWVTVDIGFWKRGNLKIWSGTVWQG